MSIRDKKILDKIYHPLLPNQFTGKNDILTQNNNLRTKPVNTNHNIEKLLIGNKFQYQKNSHINSETLNKNNIKNKIIQSIPNFPIPKKISYPDPVIKHNIIKLPDIPSITEKLNKKVKISEAGTQKSKLKYFKCSISFLSLRRFTHYD